MKHVSDLEKGNIFYRTPLKNTYESAALNNERNTESFQRESKERQMGKLERANGKGKLIKKKSQN